MNKLMNIKIQTMCYLVDILYRIGSEKSRSDSFNAEHSRGLFRKERTYFRSTIFL